MDSGKEVRSMKRRITAMLIVLVMLLGMMPGTAYGKTLIVEPYLKGLQDGKAVLGRPVSFIPGQIILANDDLRQYYTDGYEITYYIYSAGEPEYYAHVFSTGVGKTASYTLPKMLDAVDAGFHLFFQCRSGSESVVLRSNRIDTVADIADLPVQLVPKTYTGNPLKQSLETVSYTPPYGYTITYSEGTDYTVAYKNNTNVGTASVTLTGKGKFIGSITKTFQINKMPNTMTAQGKTVKIKASKLKKKKQTIKPTKSLRICNAVGSLKFKLAGVNKKKFKKYFKENARNGNITVKKGLKKGKYKLKINITAAGNSINKAGTKQIQVTVRVK